MLFLNSGLELANVLPQNPCPSSGN
ncbi:hypothetical protein CDAR_13301, partial [Caerostris darwini]